MAHRAANSEHHFGDGPGDGLCLRRIVDVGDNRHCKHKAQSDLQNTQAITLSLAFVEINGRRSAAPAPAAHTADERPFGRVIGSGLLRPA